MPFLCTCPHQLDGLCPINDRDMRVMVWQSIFQQGHSKTLKIIEREPAIAFIPFGLMTVSTT
jgi:hypothetical protein